MQKYANFCGNYNKDHEISVWIFEILRELDDKLKADFLFYVLGNNKN